MVVMKFGGTSVQDAHAIRRVVDIVRRAEARGAAPLVVVSALARVTDQLVQAAMRAANGDGFGAASLIRQIDARHRDVAESVTIETQRAPLIAALAADWQDAIVRLDALTRSRDLTHRAADAIVATGEIASSRIMAAALQAVDLAAVWVDARRVLITDDEHGNAQPDMDLTRERVRIDVRPYLAAGRLPVIGGFIGATRSGVTSTLGRGGSDYSASIFGALLHAVEIQIWTDVDGVLTADPRVIAGTRTVATLSYPDAYELARFGAKVLHPSTVGPAAAAGIPLRILNSYRADGPGTTIMASPPASPTPVTALACRRADTQDLAAIGSVLGDFAEVTTECDMAVLCAVGDRVRIDPSISEQIRRVLDGVPSCRVLPGSSSHLIVVLPQVHLAAAVALVHNRFCLPAFEGDDSCTASEERSETHV